MMSTETKSTNADVFQNIRTGDKVLWDGIKQPVEVTAGYAEGMEQIEDLENLEAPTIHLEGPRGGQKMLIQNQNNPDDIRVESFSLSSNGEWVSNLRRVEE